MADEPEKIDRRKKYASKTKPVLIRIPVDVHLRGKSIAMSEDLSFSEYVIGLLKRDARI